MSDTIVSPCGTPTTNNLSKLTSVSSGSVGDVLVGTVTIILPAARHHVVVQDYIPAGAEILNPTFDTTSAAVASVSSDTSGGGIVVPMM